LKYSSNDFTKEEIEKEIHNFLISKFDTGGFLSDALKKSFDEYFKDLV